MGILEHSLRFLAQNKKTYSERKKELKERLIDYLEDMSLKLNLRALYYREDFKKNWYEIRNCKILIGTLKKVIKFIDNPTYKQLEYVKFLANEFDYSEKIYFYIVFLVFLLVHFVRMIIFTLLFLQ